MIRVGWKSQLWLRLGQIVFERWQEFWFKVAIAPSQKVGFYVLVKVVSRSPSSCFNCDRSDCTEESYLSTRKVREAIGNPHLDDRLPGYSKPLGFLI